MNRDIYLDANALEFNKNDCGRHFSSHYMIEKASCSLIKVDETTRGGMIEVTLESYPMISRENNLYFHDGNPSLDEFDCSFELEESDGEIFSTECILSNIQNTNIKGL